MKILDRKFLFPLFVLVMVAAILVPEFYTRKERKREAQELLSPISQKIMKCKRADLIELTNGVMLAVINIRDGYVSFSDGRSIERIKITCLSPQVDKFLDRSTNNPQSREVLKSFLYQAVGKTKE